MGFLGIAKKILNNGSSNQPKKSGRMSPDNIQRTRQCACGGLLFPNRIKRSQLICSQCGHREILY